MNLRRSVGNAMMIGMAPPRTRSTGQVGRPGYDLDSLLAVAVGVFNQRGYDGTSMEHLSARLGISKSSIYHHVSGKEELLRLAVDRALDALFAATEAPDTTTGPAIDRLESLVKRSVQVLVEELPYVTLLLRIRGTPPWSGAHWPAAESSTRLSATWFRKPATRAASARMSIRD